MMRVLASSHEGKVILNPSDTVSLVANSKERAAALVIIGNDLIVSTAYTDHRSMMDMRGAFTPTSKR